MTVKPRFLPQFALSVFALIGSLCAMPTHGSDVDGFTEPYRDLDIAASEMGKIGRVLVKEGERVTKGQLLAHLDEEPLISAMKIAEAERDARGRLEASQQEVALQTEVFERLRELKDRQHANPLEVFRAKSQLEISQSQLRTVQEELKVRELEVQRLQVQLEHRRLYSPIDGIVTMIHKDEGEFTSPSDPVVIKVVQIDPLLVVFQVPASTARKLSVAQNVPVLIEGTPAQGIIESVSPTTEAQSGTNRVRVRIANPDEKLPCGASCILSLSGGETSRLTANP